MNDNFGRREKVKRIELAKQLQSQGLPLHEIAKVLGLKEETVKQYFEELQRKESGKPDVKPLSQFITSNTTIDSIFPSKLQEGFKCMKCNRYAKREAGILWDNQLFMCKACYMGLNKEESSKLFKG